MIKLKRYALFSAADEGKVPALVDYAQALIDRGFIILASGGTFRYLTKEIRIGVVDIAEIVGEVILEHRVVTLGREIFAAVLSRLGNEKDEKELAALKLGGVIEVVHMDIYHLAKAIELEWDKDRELRDWQKLVEKIDVGGPSFLRAAAKGGRFVTTSPEDGRFDDVLGALDVSAKKLQSDPKIKLLRLELARDAEIVAEQHSKKAQELYGLLIDATKAEIEAAAA